jgi:hypothetical protein
MNRTEIFTIIVAAGGWVVVILQAVFGFLERRRNKEDDILLKTVDYFTAGSQQRSVGISLIEGLIKKRKSYHEILAPLLANQLVYLLLSSDSEFSVNDERNLVRIYFLLRHIFTLDIQKHWDIRNEVLDAISRRLENGEKSKITVGNMTLSSWQKELEKIT